MNYCEELHKILEQGKRFDFKSGFADLPASGIYILYQKGEIGHGKDRIVRIGTHVGDGNLKQRIISHFEKENKNRSIFRKNIGRAMLNKDKNPYLKIWNYDTTAKSAREKYAGEVDKNFERQLEKKISKYIQDNFYFKVLEVQNKADRLRLEARLIGTVSNCKICCASKGWLGNFSPEPKIKASGLWLVNELYKDELSKEELEEIKRRLIYVRS